jgi:hypothetical protein
MLDTVLEDVFFHLIDDRVGKGFNVIVNVFVFENINADQLRLLVNGIGYSLNDQTMKTAFFKMGYISDFTRLQDH